MRIAIRHTTHYEFSEPVAHGLHRLRLKPKPTHGQQVHDWTMRFEGANPETEYDDHHHNWTTLVSVEPGTRALTVDCWGTVDTSDNAGVVGPHIGNMPLWSFLSQTKLTRPGARLRELVGALRTADVSPLDLLHDLSCTVRDTVRYATGHTTVETTAEEALETGHGVCQDHAHVFIGAARLLGIPARYVSGYLVIDGTVHQEAGHGWAEAHIDGLGWVGFDVSNAISPDERYVRVATGCDYRCAAPVMGLFVGAGEAALKVNLAVEQQMVEQ